MTSPTKNGPTNSQNAPVTPAARPLPRRRGGAVSAAGAIRVGADMSAEQPGELGVDDLLRLREIRVDVAALADDRRGRVRVRVVHLGRPGRIAGDGVVVEDLQRVSGRPRLKLAGLGGQ